MPILTDQERCGTLVAGRYRLESILGRGGMGVVFRASDDTGPVAVKILRPEFAGDPVLAKRFVREARAAASIRHPNVVEVLDLGVEPDGTIYQVLQLLEGQSLRDHLQAKGKLSVERMIEILMPVMSALELAHERGIVHRDLKPDNLFLARRGDQVVPTLLDFGIAKVLDQKQSFATNTGSIMGTPAYMSPEQANGVKDQGPAVDVWAMGIIAFECLRGAPPFSGHSPAHVMLKILTERPPPVDADDDSVPAGVARAIERALERDPARRHASIRAFGDALREGALSAGLAVPEQGRNSTVSALSLSPPAAQPKAAEDSGPGGDISIALDSGADRIPTAPRAQAHATAATEPAIRKSAAQRVVAPVVADVAAAAPDVARSDARRGDSRRGLVAAGVAALVLLSLFGVYSMMATPTAPSEPRVTAPPAPVPPPTAAIAVHEPPPSEPVVAGDPVVVEPVAPPATEVTRPPSGRARPPRTTTTSGTATTATSEPPPTTTAHEAASHDHGHAVPGVVEW